MSWDCKYGQVSRDVRVGCSMTNLGCGVIINKAFIYIYIYIERERERENSNSKTLFYKDYSLVSVKNLSNN